MPPVFPGPIPGVVSGWFGGANQTDDSAGALHDKLS
jgi:hypothetical protein